ncbi:MAG: AAA family ATPase [Eubacteriales bacterium]|nr:AAA family ATPase [Eubacteriales bacterium]MDD4323451.1 AAA family ATPase [Eubacteriales bacterium]MDD4540694.1 AAA family ATPase [Eubacteriales bacterium]
MDIIKIQILTDQEDQRQELLEKLIAFDYLKVQPMIDLQGDLLESMRADKSDVVLIAAEYLGDGYKASELITNQYPAKAVIILTEDFGEKPGRIVASGATDIISPSIDASALNKVIYRVFSQHKHKQERILAGHIQRSNLEGTILTVFSSKGGTGKTFISTNLAIALKLNTGKKVCIVDLDLDYGGVALALSLPVTYSISNVVNQIKNLDQELLNSYLLSHESGVKVLAANPDPGYNDYINSDHINTILRVLQSAYDYVIIDMPGHFTETVGPAFTLADYVILVTVPEVLTLKNIKTSLVLFNDLNFSANKLRLVLNKASKLGISKKDVESTLNMDVYSTIPEDYKGVRKSQNEGKAYVLSYPRSKTSKGFKSLVSALAQETARE